MDVNDMHQDDDQDEDEHQDGNSSTTPLCDDDDDDDHETTTHPPLSDDEDIDLESLSEHHHPCLARGRFSVFNSLDVMHVFRNRDINCKLDMDGVVGISR